MLSSDLGNKYTCYKCGGKFYDLKRPEPICPKCGADQREGQTLRPPDKTERKRLPRPVVEEPTVEEEVLEEDASEEDEVEEPVDDDDNF